MCPPFIPFMKSHYKNMLHALIADYPSPLLTAKDFDVTMTIHAQNVNFSSFL